MACRRWREKANAVPFFTSAISTELDRAGGRPPRLLAPGFGRSAYSSFRSGRWPTSPPKGAPACARLVICWGSAVGTSGSSRRSCPQDTGCHDGGHVPVVAAVTAGTDSSGAIDPLDVVQDSSRRHGVWFHFDAAYGGPAVLSSRSQNELAALKDANSLVLDPPHMNVMCRSRRGCR